MTGYVYARKFFDPKVPVEVKRDEALRGSFIGAHTLLAGALALVVATVP